MVLKPMGQNTTVSGLVLWVMQLALVFIPEKILAPWEMVVQTPEVDPYRLPPNRHIVDVFDEAKQSLLIFEILLSGLHVQPLVMLRLK